MTACSNKSEVKVVDNSVDDYIEISKVTERIRENGFKEIQVSGENTTDDYMLFRYRVVWEDKDGFEVKSISSNWTNFPAHKNANFKINVIAPNKKAVTYKLYINK